ncbi:MAG: MFS transporter [Calditrichaceae bacterium]|nr:MFS transporter [Calditrichaceae bacterium]MBN2710731.1 MFS transporter [Calditrichaceae bacterium]RQV92760.1 MAG: MFS transporter [Calditrichota bacterium]
MFKKDIQFYKFSAYGFFKNLQLFEIFFILFLRETGLSYLQIGSLYSIRQITTNLLEIPSGIFADTVGRKTTLIAGMFFYLVSFISFYFSNDFLFLGIAMLFFGAGEACRSGTHKAMILIYLEKNNYLQYKTHYYGATRSWSQIGSALSSLLAITVLLIDHNYRLLFLVSSIPYAIDTIIIWTYPDYLNGEKKLEGRKKHLFLEFKETTINFFQLFKNAAILRTLFSASSYIALYKSMKDYLQPMLKSFALGVPVLTAVNKDQRSAIIIGIIYFFIYLMTSYTSKNAWKVEQKFRHLTSAINITYLAGIGSVFFAGIFMKFDLILISVIIFIGLYLVQNIRRPLTVSYLGERINSKVMASGLSAESQLETIIVAIIAPVFGFFVDVWDLSTALIIIAGIYLAIFPLIKLKK